MAKNSLTKKINRLSFTRKSRANCWQLLSGLLDIGIELPAALELVEISVSAQGDRSARDVMSDLRKEVRLGRAKQAFLYYAKGSDGLMFNQMGRVDPRLMFKGAHRVLDLENRISTAIMGALAQPILLSLVLIGFLYMLGTQLFPILSEFLNPDDWNTRVRLLYIVSTTFVQNSVLIGLSILFGIFTISFLQKNLTGPLRRILDYMPPFSIYKVVTTASFFIMLTELARAGLSINRSELEGVARSCRPYEKRHITHIGRNLEMHSLGEALWKGSSGWPDLELRAISKIYGSRPDGMEKVSDYLEKWIARAEARINRSAKALNMIMLGLVAFMIATIGQFIYVDISAGFVN